LIFLTIWRAWRKVYKGATPFTSSSTCYILLQHHIYDINTATEEINKAKNINVVHSSCTAIKLGGMMAIIAFTIDKQFMLLTIYGSGGIQTFLFVYPHMSVYGGSLSPQHDTSSGCG
jgi:hypothetical protein